MHAKDTQLVKDLRSRYPEYKYDKKEQKRVIRDAKDGKDTTEFICRNLGLVCLVVDKYYFGSDVEDAVAEGIATLLTAAKLYDPSRDRTFSAYAGRAIMFNFQRMQRREDGLLNVPNHLFTPIGRYRSRSGYFDDLSDEEVAEELKIRKTAVPYVREMARMKEVHLEQPIQRTGGKEEEEWTIEDTLEDTRTDKELDEFTYREDLASLFQRTGLSDRDIDILKRRFGVGYDRSYTLQEISDEFGISRERVRQLEGKALRKLKFHSPEKRYFTMNEPKDYSKEEVIRVQSKPEYLELMG
jgi:RNA polymerase primary sigma factor